MNYNFTYEQTLEQERHRVFPSDMSERTMAALAHHDNVIRALEKQVPKSPHVETNSWNTKLLSLSCPTCGGRLGVMDSKNNKLATRKSCRKYCIECGQYIDWSKYGGEI